MTEYQRTMLFKLFNRAFEKANPECTSREAYRAYRDELTVRAFGALRSWTTFNNRDVDKMKAALMAIIDPSNVKAQVKQIQMPRSRVIFGLRRCASDEYIAQIAREKFDTSDWENLPLKFDVQGKPAGPLGELHMTICNRSASRARKTREQSAHDQANPELAISENPF